MSRVRKSLDHKRIRRLVWLVLVVFFLFCYSLQNVAGSTYCSMLVESYGIVSSPPVILQSGTAGTSATYANDTCAKASVEPPLFDYVDNNEYDVDSSADKGTHSNFTAQKYGLDAVYDTLTDENISGTITYRGVGSVSTFSQKTSVSPSKPSGTASTDVLICKMAIDQTGTITAPSGWTLMVRTSGTGISAGMWWALGSVSSTTWTFSQASGVAFIEGYIGVNNTTPMDATAVGQANSASTDVTAPSITTVTDGAYIVTTHSLIKQNTGSMTPWSGGTETGDGAGFTNNNNMYVLGEGVYAEQATAGASGTKTSVATGSGVNVGLTGALRPAALPPNYELDLEEQFTSVKYTSTNEELCIKTGTFSGSEDIQVEVRNTTGGSWDWVMNLTAGQWNNVSVTSHLTSSIFTVRFLGGTEMGDTTEDSWNIDATLLHVWTDDATFDYVLRVNNTETDSWQVRLKKYGDSNINRLRNCTVSFHNSSDGTSRQIYIQNGACINQTGSWYDLGDSETIYIAMKVEATSTGTSYVRAYLEILVPNTSTYVRYIVTFEII